VEHVAHRANARKAYVVSATNLKMKKPFCEYRKDNIKMENKD
jgi:hypothetical protein